jgi:hypothetical protein
VTETTNQDKGTATHAAGTPRWVKVFGIITLVIVVLIVVLIVTGRGGPHSPRRHGAPADATPATSTSRQTGPPAGVAHTQP